jgi:hypothetical protein
MDVRDHGRKQCQSGGGADVTRTREIDPMVTVLRFQWTAAISEPICPFSMIHTSDPGKLNTEADLLAVIRTAAAYAASLKSVICASNARLKAGLAVQRST